MGFSYNKAMSLKPSRELKFSTFFIALITAAAVFVPFIIADGGYFLFYGDFNVQQIPFYQMCHAAVREGNFGWNFLTDLGADFLGSYAFYLLGSPFFWLTIPFPNWLVPYLMGPLLILKFACAALTAYLYIRRFTRTPEAARLGGILYAFCGFSIYNTFFNHFHESIVVFPLLLLSLELLLTENRRGLFAFCVFLSCTVNYYFFFGMVIFVLIYLIIRVVSKAVKLTFGRFLILFIEAVIGLLMSAILLLPAIYSTLSLDRINEILTGWNAIMYGKEQIYLNIIECFFFPPDIPARPVFFPDANVKWSSLGAWLPLFSMVGVFAYCQKNKGNWLKRIICTSFVFALFPILNSLFSALNHAYYARWFYMPVLMCVLATVMVLEDREAAAERKSALKWVAFITAAFGLVIGLFPTKDKDGALTFGLFTENTNPTYILRFCITVAIAVISLVILAILLKSFKKYGVAFFNTALSLVCIISVIYGSVFIGTGKQHSFDEDEVIIPSILEADVQLEGEPDTFRIDTYSCCDNTGVSLGYSSINAFHSIVPQSIIDFYRFVGEERNVASRPKVENYAIRNLLSVKYVLNLINQESFVENEEALMPGYKYVDHQDGYNIYENENFIPYGFSYDNYISYNDCTEYAENLRAAIMLKAIVLDDEQIAKYGTLMEPIDKEQLIYGDFKEELHDDAILLSVTSATEFEQTKNGFAATVERDKANLVFFSIPYEKGWSATVNGKPVEIEKVNVGFMAVKVEAGISNIEFTYKNPVIALAIQISVAATALFLIYMLICLCTRKARKEKVTVYPEGDALIEKWYSYDIADSLEEEQLDKKYEFSLDKIAEELNHEYPVAPSHNEFLGGFKVNTLDKNDENPIDKD